MASEERLSSTLTAVIGVPGLTLCLLLLVPIVALLLGAEAGDVAAALRDGETVPAIATSLGCAAAAVGLGLLLGVPTGWWLARRPSRLGQVVGALIDLPLVLPHPILGIGLLLVFGRQQLVGGALEDGLGISIVSAVPGIILAMTSVSAPFIVKGARDGFAAVPPPMLRAARSLGASEGVALWTVALPLASRHIRSGALLAWARAVSEFGSIVVLAYFPLTAPVLIWDRFSARGLHAALAPAALLLAVCLLIFLLLQALAPGQQPAPRGERR